MINLIKKLKNSSGFSMVEISMAIGLLGICGLAIMKLSDNTSRSSHETELVVSKGRFTSIISKYVNSDSACIDFKALNTFSSTWTPLSFSSLKVAGIEGNPNLPLASGRKFKNFRIKELSGKRIEINDLGKVEKYNNGISNKTELVIKLVLETYTEPGLKSASDTKGKRDEVFYFNVPIVSDNNRKVLRCGQENSLESTCLGLKGTYNSSKKRCEFSNKNSCVVRGGYIEGKEKNVFTQGYNCPDGSDKVATPPGLVTGYIPCSGKKCSGADPVFGASSFICVEC
jgi:hypothetical protein